MSDFDDSDADPDFIDDSSDEHYFSDHDSVFSGKSPLKTCLGYSSAWLFSYYNLADKHDTFSTDDDLATHSGSYVEIAVEIQASEGKIS